MNVIVSIIVLVVGWYVGQALVLYMYIKNSYIPDDVLISVFESFSPAEQAFTAILDPSTYVLYRIAIRRRDEEKQ